MDRQRKVDKIVINPSDVEKLGVLVVSMGHDSRVQNSSTLTAENMYRVGWQG
jgi:hypothetical protein